NRNPNLQTLLIGSAILLIPVALIMLQPDTGSALTFFALIFVFYREGYVSGNFLLFGGACIILFILSLLLPEWIVVVALAIICAMLVYFSKKTKKNIMTGLVAFICSTMFVYGVDFAYNDILQSHQRNRIE